MESPRTTTRPSKDFVRPSASMAMSENRGLMSEDAGAGGGCAPSARRCVLVSGCVLCVISWPPGPVDGGRIFEDRKAAGEPSSVLCHLSSGAQHHVDRLTDTHFLRPVGQRFDQEDEFGTLFPAIDDRRREFRRARDKADARCEVSGTAVAMYFHHVTIGQPWQDG